MIATLFRPSIVLALLLIPAAFVRAQQVAPPPPADASSLLREADQYAQEKQFDRAVEAYKKVIELAPDQAAAYHGLGSAYNNMGRAPDALAPLRNAARLDPENPQIRANLGIILNNLRRGDEALSELLAAKSLAPDDARIQNEIGNTLHNTLGRFDEALAAYQEARRLNPAVPAVHHNIGLMLMRIGRFPEAVGPFEEALRLDPVYRNARYHLSNAYSILGRYREAISSWTKFLELVPNGREALLNRAWNGMYAGGRGREAAEDARAFLKVAGWRDQGSQFMALIAHLGYRQAREDLGAKQILDEAAKRADASVWPYPVIRYMRGELTAEELLAAASDNDQKTEAHTYLGMDHLLRGCDEAARRSFGWVKEYGNRRYLEYPLAVMELNRLGN